MPRTERPVCETCGKQSLTRAEAHRAARNLNGHQQNEGWPLAAYRCGRTWHVGHLRTKRDKRATPKTRRGGKARGVRPRPVTPPDQLPPELR